MTVLEARRMVPADYEVMMQASRLREVDQKLNLALSAWWNQAVKVTKGKGKNIQPKYQNFTEFFDYEKELRIAKGQDKTPQEQRIIELAELQKQVNQPKPEKEVK